MDEHKKYWERKLLEDRIESNEKLAESWRRDLEAVNKIRQNLMARPGVCRTEMNEHLHQVLTYLQYNVSECLAACYIASKELDENEEK